MPSWLRRALTALMLFALAALTLYWLAFLQHPKANGEFALDLAEVRRLARADSGTEELPTGIRVETVGHFHFPGAIVRVGKSWSMVPLGIYSYQVIFPSSRLLIDTGAAQKPIESQYGDFDAAAFARVVEAMNDADSIVVTHEHFDHLGGLAVQPNVLSLMAKTHLTQTQADGTRKNFHPGTFPSDALAASAPLRAPAYYALAPGVVLIQTPGHTQGSQSVYVQRADGTEFLFIGDVAWFRENIDLTTGRAPLVSSMMIREDRQAVLQQLVALKKLQTSEPSLHVVPGHDVSVVEALKSAQLLGNQFIAR